MITGQLGKAFRPGVRWLWALGLLIPLSMGVFLIALVLMSLTKDTYTPPKLVTAGTISQYERGVPKYFEAERVWVLRTPEDIMMALYDIDPLSNCTTPWWQDLEHLGRKGWFQDACRGSFYDLEGQCFGGPCEVGLSRFEVTLNGREVVVNLTDLRAGPARDDSAEPVTPETE
jgi:hypothetical protein